MDDLSKRINMFRLTPTVGKKLMKSTPIKSKSGAAKFERTMKKGLGIPGYLSGGQAKLDKNKDGKISGKDFAILRKEKAKGRGKGLQDEKLRPGKVKKANVGLLVRAITKGYKPTSKFLKRRLELTSAGKISPKKTAIAGGTGAAAVGVGKTAEGLKKSKEFQEGRVAGSNKAKKQLSNIKRKLGEVTGYITGKKYGGESKIKKVMGEFKDKKLKSSSGKKVTSRKQAIAIALSEARKKSGKKA